ncbi:unnamed protein product [Symbiodinium pilosum]|uniref:Uncharacterized protein n=1 Tax=Symbiodinium pilosum TaxID=2952 RepID=A0A812YIF3_SYMPI|nr:unnamed protein product [Symbiodinium pilosum]
MMRFLWMRTILMGMCQLPCGAGAKASLKLSRTASYGPAVSLPRTFCRMSTWRPL